MSFKAKALAAFFAAATLCAGTSFATPPEQTAVIVDSGSTNSPGSRFTVGRDGKIKSIVYSGHAVEEKPRLVPTAAIKQLFADLDAAGPIGSLPHGQCMKSASFGKTVTVEFAGQTSPDLTCPGNDARTKALSADVRAITRAF